MRSAKPGNHLKFQVTLLPLFPTKLWVKHAILAPINNKMIDNEKVSFEKKLPWSWKRKFSFIKRFGTKDCLPDIPSAQVSAERALGLSWFVNTGNCGFKVWLTALSLCHSFICPCTELLKKNKRIIMPGQELSPTLLGFTRRAPG